MAKNQGRKTFFTVAPVLKRDAKTGAFVDYTLPSGERTRVMSKRVFEGALDSADKKLRDIARERKNREAAA